MPSHLHEALLQLFRNRPELAPELLRTLQTNLPDYADVRIDSAELTEIQPAEYRADLVIALTDGVPRLGIVVEVQLSTDDRKRFVWPAYVANLRARLKCQVCLLVIAGDEAVARWAAKPVNMGGGNHFAPLVLRPASVPEITDTAQAQMIQSSRCSQPSRTVATPTSTRPFRLPAPLSWRVHVSTRIGRFCMLISSWPH
jgi:hypothetical protein